MKRSDVMFALANAWLIAGLFAEHWIICTVVAFMAAVLCTVNAERGN